MRRMRSCWGVALVWASVAHAGCGGSAPASPSTPITGAALATAYLNEVVNLLQTNSYKRRDLDWSEIRAAALDAGQGAATVAGASPGIRKALQLVDDSHSRWVAAPPSTTVVGYSSKTCRASGAAPPVLPADIGYVRVTAFSGTGTAITAFADSIQTAIRDADRDGLAGWVVDLRGNGGGNMWPMLAGLSPLLTTPGTSIVGYFIDPDGMRINWQVADGVSRAGGNVAARASASYTLRQPSPLVAVLVDNGVASSGEATFIAFRERPGTRSFGVATCGLSTAVASFSMSDGASLLIAVSLMADRNGHAFGGPVPPDELVSDPVDEAVARAVAWLRSAR
jgi:hypothetical protein